MTIISQKTGTKTLDYRADQKSRWDASPALRNHFPSFEAFLLEGGIAGVNRRTSAQAKIREETAKSQAAKAADLKSRWNSSVLLRNLYGTFEAFQKANEAAEAAISNGRLKK